MDYLKQLSSDLDALVLSIQESPNLDQTLAHLKEIRTKERELLVVVREMASALDGVARCRGVLELKVIHYAEKLESHVAQTVKLFEVADILTKRYACDNAQCGHIGVLMRIPVAPRLNVLGRYLCPVCGHQGDVELAPAEADAMIRMGERVEFLNFTAPAIKGKAKKQREQLQERALVVLASQDTGENSEKKSN